MRVEMEVFRSSFTACSNPPGSSHSPDVNLQSVRSYRRPGKTRTDPEVGGRPRHTTTSWETRQKNEASEHPPGSPLTGAACPRLPCLCGLWEVISAAQRRRREEQVTCAEDSGLSYWRMQMKRKVKMSDLHYTSMGEVHLVGFLGCYWRLLLKGVYVSISNGTLCIEIMWWIGIKMGWNHTYPCILGA